MLSEDTTPLEIEKKEEETKTPESFKIAQKFIEDQLRSDKEYKLPDYGFGPGVIICS